jgi:nitronate monooxygenase
MSIRDQLQALRLPVICSPMFIASGPKLVIEQCKAGFVGSFPALNARPQEMLVDWLDEIVATLGAVPAGSQSHAVAPFAVNQIVHVTNTRLAHDLKVCVDRKVPIIITSLRAPNEIIDEVHRYGGISFHDVINIRHANKALEAGVDGLILVCAGAGGHAGTLSPFALLGEVREIFSGPVILAGAMSSGSSILAAIAAGADFAYVGSRWLASPEANVPEAYRQMIVDSTAADIRYTDYFSGVLGNYLSKSIATVGFNPDDLPKRDPAKKLNMEQSDSNQVVKAWRDVWSAGQGVGTIHEVRPVAEISNQLEREYHAALARLGQRAPARQSMAA